MMMVMMTMMMMTTNKRLIQATNKNACETVIINCGKLEKAKEKSRNAVKNRSQSIRLATSLRNKADSQPDVFLLLLVEDVVVEEELKLLIRIVDTELLERVHFQVLEPKDVTVGIVKDEHQRFS
jgi:hypothetical protein